MLTKGILFLCAASPARTQLAESLARNILGPDTLIVSSAQGPLDPYATEVLREVGLEASENAPQGIDEVDPSEVGLVITLVANDESLTSLDTSPLREAPRLRWAIPDPASSPSDSAEDALTRFRAARDRIRGMMELFVSDEHGAPEFHRV
jgi:arsenate reductase (thioredoxin)